MQLCQVYVLFFFFQSFLFGLRRNEETKEKNSVLTETVSTSQSETFLENIGEQTSCSKAKVEPYSIQRKIIVNRQLYEFTIGQCLREFIRRREAKGGAYR